MKIDLEGMRVEIDDLFNHHGIEDVELQRDIATMVHRKLRPELERLERERDDLRNENQRLLDEHAGEAGDAAQQEIQRLTEERDAFQPMAEAFERTLDVFRGERGGTYREVVDYMDECLALVHRVNAKKSPPAPAEPSEVERLAMQDLARWIQGEFDRGAGHPEDESIDARFEDILASYEMVEEARDRRGES